MRRTKGMTLIEVLVVIAILAILILISIFLFKNQLFKARDARRKSDIHKIQQALEEYEKDHDCYLEELSCETPGDDLKPYLNEIPCDVQTDNSFHYDHEDSPCPKWYRVYATLENLSDKDLMPGIGAGGTNNYYQSSPNAPVPECSTGFWGCKGGVCRCLVSQSECSPNYANLPMCLMNCPGTECNP